MDAACEGGGADQERAAQEVSHGEAPMASESIGAFDTVPRHQFTPMFRSAIHLG